MELIREFIRSLFYQLIIILVVFIIMNGGQIALRQIDSVQFARLIQLETGVQRLDHLDGYGIETFAFRIPVRLVLGQNFFIALDITGEHVRSVEPHIGIVACQERINTDLINQCLRCRIQTVVGRHSIEIRDLTGAVINYRIVVRSLNAYHLKEFASLVRGQSSSLFLAQGLGILVIFLSSYDHLAGHGNVRARVFMIIHYKLKSGQEILRGAVCLLFAVFVYPFHAFTKLERPGKTVILRAPVFRQSRDQFAFRVVGQKSIDQVRDNVGV